MEDTTNESVWQSAKRGYVLANLGDDVNKEEIAQAVLELNKEQEDPENPDFLIIRVNFLRSEKGNYDTVIPVCARDYGTLRKKMDEVRSVLGTAEENFEELYQDDELSSRDSNHPYPPHETPCYIPMEEANPTDPGYYPAPTGRNAWG